MNEQLTITTARASKLDFKSEKLTQLTISLDAVYQEAAEMGRTANRRIACILSEIESTKCYAEDGYKSVADYAKEVFGIERSNAYQLATAGDVYNDFDRTVESGETPSNAYRVLADMTPSKLAETVSAGCDKAIEAIESGEITANSTQKELREWAKNAKAADTQSGTVLKQYIVTPLTATVLDLSAISDGATIPDIEAAIHAVALSAGYDAAEIVKISKGYSHIFAIGERAELKATMTRFAVILEKQCGKDIATDSFIYQLTEKKPKNPDKTDKKSKAKTMSDVEVAKYLGVDVETVKKMRAGNVL